ncbi:MAG: hypothetical protein A3F31_05570 [Candidatus Levybacteria bacterium RIFCSPHIGHO2_12_FULL_38_12]|nr:MAG: hypothetical protein A2770_00055 [Candidatus Levybacteria bacterium RIFCSPHIGHO2_01_FULL_38_12]OGH23086.1 MAG: hypothetical protein A3F31_05570 [Candidatus Levybacteria bacterium RIFCSPHIGHO2_12_FULL_38_12]OGH33804.1 MAG: hypothetical protein A3A47_02030 [Candidatus Levybacteria bacterium RIFCSPLOWO2_01_FULL_37_20]OGH44779.1 MAG: hypothetical protein A3J14_02290 [Candidatus Levybacteria bacterium RIFCSPLOWO2_02_FULL_37_18]
MDISIVSEDSLRIKGKRASFIVVDPGVSIPKTPADFVVTLNGKKENSLVKVDGFRVVINGAGEYEIGGIKLAAHAFEDDLLYDIAVDGIDIILSNSEVIKKEGEKIKESHIVIVRTDSVVDESSVTAASPRIVALYGKHTQESAKVLGRQDLKPVNKISYTLEKLPQEMEVVVLG